MFRGGVFMSGVVTHVVRVVPVSLLSSAALCSRTGCATRSGEVLQLLCPVFEEGQYLFLR